MSTSGSAVKVPPDEPGLDWEGELVVVGRPLSQATAEQAQQAVFGYAAFNDITARTAQRLSTQWTLGKNVDRSGPLSATSLEGVNYDARQVQTMSRDITRPYSAKSA